LSGSPVESGLFPMADLQAANSIHAVSRRRVMTWCLVGAHVVGGLGVAGACAGLMDPFPTSPVVDTSTPIGRFLHAHSLLIFLSIALPQAGLLGMWLGLGASPRRHRLVGGLLVVVYLGALTAGFVPARYFPARHFYNYFLPVLVPSAAVALLARGVRRWFAQVVLVTEASSPIPGLQFSIRLMLIATAVVAVVLGLKPGKVEPSLLTTIVVYMVFGLCMGSVVLASLWAALAPGHPAPRIAVVLLFAGFIGVMPFYYVGLSRSAQLTAAAVSSITQALIVVASLLVIRWQGFRLVAHGRLDPTACTMPPP